ncbi:MAG: hypothetical protein IKJ55_02835 [Clostridia bacterium]|nr:hypothetical protein [Clostridia bacterium]
MENNLKKSMLGYSKKSVLAFIANLDASYQQKINAQNELHQKNAQKINELEKKISELQKENELLLQKSNDVSNIFVDAKRFSDEMIAKTKAEEAEKVEKLRLAYQKENEKLNAYRNEIDTLKISIQNAMQAFDTDLSNRSQLFTDTEIKFNSNLTFHKTYRLIEE